MVEDMTTETDATAIKARDLLRFGPFETDLLAFKWVLNDAGVFDRLEVAVAHNPQMQTDWMERTEQLTIICTDGSRWVARQAGVTEWKHGGWDDGDSLVFVTSVPEWLPG